MLRHFAPQMVKIRQEYDRKQKAVEIQKKIAYSNEVNASRLKTLSAQVSTLEFCLCWRSRL
jgi:hypothetical protein